MLVKMHTTCPVSYKLKKSIAFTFFMQDVSVFHQKYCHCSVVITHQAFKIFLKCRFTFKCLRKKNSKKIRHLKSCKTVYCKSTHSNTNFWGYFNNRSMEFLQSIHEIQQCWNIKLYIKMYITWCEILYVTEVSMNCLYTHNYFFSIVLVLAGIE